jgi:hypothetical protein
MYLVWKHFSGVTDHRNGRFRWSLTDQHDSTLTWQPNDECAWYLAAQPCLDMVSAALYCCILLIYMPYTREIPSSGKPLLFLYPVHSRCTACCSSVNTGRRKQKCQEPAGMDPAPCDAPGHFHLFQKDAILFILFDVCSCVQLCAAVHPLFC